MASCASESDNAHVHVRVDNHVYEPAHDALISLLNLPVHTRHSVQTARIKGDGQLVTHGRPETQPLDRGAYVQPICQISNGHSHKATDHAHQRYDFVENTYSTCTLLVFPDQNHARRNEGGHISCDPVPTEIPAVMSGRSTNKRVELNVEKFIFCIHVDGLLQQHPRLPGEGGAR